MISVSYLILPQSLLISSYIIIDNSHFFTRWIHRYLCRPFVFFVFTHSAYVISLLAYYIRDILCWVLESKSCSWLSWLESEWVFTVIQGRYFVKKQTCISYHFFKSKVIMYEKEALPHIFFAYSAMFLHYEVPLRAVVDVW